MDGWMMGGAGALVHSFIRASNGRYERAARDRGKKRDYRGRERARKEGRIGCEITVPNLDP